MINTLSDKSVAELAQLINEFRRRVGVQGEGPYRRPNGDTDRLFAEITSRDAAGEYSGKQVYRDASGWSDTTDDMFSGANLKEQKGDDGAQVGDVVEVFIGWDDTTGDVIYWFFYDSKSFWAEITGGTSPYSWTALEGDASTSTSRTGSSNALEVNGRTGIPTGSIVRMFPDPFDEAVYRFEFHGADTGGSVKDVSFTGEHQETSRGSATAWVRSSQGAGRGFKETLDTGVCYYDASDEVLYGFQYDKTYDANGHLLEVSAERRYTIDVPEDC